ncbi:MAG: 1-acyl-sn-glycerol-3-phosphate acyltransferase [Candidatus Polarisedimenticolaceae bacterium]|nr:1-acyl-sn-glycerol-3-phosphate acyltransferase [Candidatus Polarisedimenticolaceae bacterium]
MVHAITRILWLMAHWLELMLFTLPLYLLTFVPHKLLASFYPTLFRHWCRVFVRALGVDLRLHQKNREPLPKQFIMIANHPSAFEDIGLPALFDVHSLAKEEVKNWFISGRISQAAGTLFVQRSSRASRKEAFDTLVEALRSGKNIALYPEGGCKDIWLHSDFRYGAFDLSLQTGIPIVPIFIHYESQQDFHWADGIILVRKLWDFMMSQNNRANYYQFDAFNPADFPDKETYTQHVYDCYQGWQKRYLE